MPAHDVDYKILGDDMQFVEVELDPGESAVAEAGAMMYMTGGIGMQAIFGDGSGQRARRHDVDEHDDAEADAECRPDIPPVAAHREELAHATTSRTQLALRSRRSSSARSRI